MIPRKRGRPPLPPGKAKRSFFTTRLTDDLKCRLMDAAKAAGYSLSEEIERRLERSFFADDVISVATALAKTLTAPKL
jgi:hypothetical protein